MSVGNKILRQKMRKDIFYVVAYKYGNTWYTLLENNKCCWVFEHSPKMYKRLVFAQKALKKVRMRYSYDEAYVFKSWGIELIGADSYKKWKDDPNRAVAHIVKES